MQLFFNEIKCLEMENKKKCKIKCKHKQSHLVKQYVYTLHYIHMSILKSVRRMLTNENRKLYMIMSPTDAQILILNLSINTSHQTFLTLNLTR